MISFKEYTTEAKVPAARVGRDKMTKQQRKEFNAKEAEKENKRLINNNKLTLKQHDIMNTTNPNLWKDQVQNVRDNLKRARRGQKPKPQPGPTLRKKERA